MHVHAPLLPCGTAHNMRAFPAMATKAATILAYPGADITFAHFAVQQQWCGMLDWANVKCIWVLSRPGLLQLHFVRAQLHSGIAALVTATATVATATVDASRPLNVWYATVKSAPIEESTSRRTAHLARCVGHIIADVEYIRIDIAPHASLPSAVTVFLPIVV